MSEEVVTPPAADASAAKAAEVKPANASQEAGKSADAVTPTPPAAAAVAEAASDKKPDPKPDEKPQAEAKVVPEKYELKVPEGSLLDPERVKSISEFAKQNKLSNVEAQSIIDGEHDAVQAHVDSRIALLNERSKQWLEEAKADKDLGGDKFNENVEIAKRAMEQLFDGAEIKKFMDTTGFGNNPTVIKGFLKIGRMLQNDKIMPPPGGQPPEKLPMESRLYDHPTSPKT